MAFQIDLMDKLKPAGTRDEGYDWEGPYVRQSMLLMECNWLDEWDT